jgi:hypothetical protein
MVPRVAHDRDPPGKNSTQREGSMGGFHRSKSDLSLWTSLYFLIFFALFTFLASFSF